MLSKRIIIYLEELKQKYNDKFPDGAITRKKQLEDHQLEVLIQTVNDGISCCYDEIEEL